MKEFIKSLFSDKDGSISSKRLIMFLLVFTFVFIVYTNLFSGKTIDASLLSSLVALIWATLGSVFGENVTNIFKKTDKDSGQQ
jgi:hypothetical protein